MALLTPLQVADILSLTRRTIYRWIKEGRLTAVKVGRAVRIDSEEVQRLLGRNITE